MSLNDSLVAQRTELERLGFQVLHIEHETLIAGRRSFYWECLFTLVNYTVFVRRVTTLSSQMMESDRSEYLLQAKRLNPSGLPRGLQAGNAVLIAYIADQVDADAQLLCEPNFRRYFAQFYIRAALDLGSNTTFLFKKKPFWGALYYSKFRYLLTRLLLPGENSYS